MKIAAADPMGSAIYSWIKTGKLESHGSSITEGIGQGRVTANLEGAPIDDAYRNYRRGSLAHDLRPSGT